MRAMFKWAVSEGQVPDNPTLGVTRQKVESTGYATWDESDDAHTRASGKDAANRLASFTPSAMTTSFRTAPCTSCKNASSRQASEAGATTAAAKRSLAMS